MDHNDDALSETLPKGSPPTSKCTGALKPEHSANGKDSVALMRVCWYGVRMLRNDWRYSRRIAGQVLI
jgi:hypothetical protein